MPTLLSNGDFERHATDPELPDTQNVPDGSLIYAARITQGATSLTLENTTDDAFVGPAVGASSTSPISIGANEIIMAVSDKSAKEWIVATLTT